MLYRVIPAGDLDIVDDDIVLVSDLDEVRQELAARFRFFLGEWFLDAREGVPWFRDVMVQNPDLAVVRSVFREVALSLPEVVSLPVFDLLFDKATRTLSFNFEAITVTGETLVVTPTDELFIINVQRAA